MERTGHHDLVLVDGRLGPLFTNTLDVAVRRIRPVFVFWLLLVLFSYYGLFFTYWGNYFHGGGPLDKAMLSGAIVVAAYHLSLEVFRDEKKLWARIVTAFIGIPLFLFACFDLWFAIKYALSG